MEWRRRGPLRPLARYQAFLFFPLLGLLAWSMHVAGAAFLVCSRSRHRGLEVLTLLTHVPLYVCLLVFALGPGEALLVIVIHKAVGGFYLASVFAPNHKGMPQTDDDSDLDFLRMQVVTSRNIRGHWWIDLLFGSLNYPGRAPPVSADAPQPAASLERDRQGGLRRDRCPVPRETSLLGSNDELLRFLHGVGAPLRSPARAAAG